MSSRIKHVTVRVCSFTSAEEESSRIKSVTHSRIISQDFRDLSQLNQVRYFTNGSPWSVRVAKTKFSKFKLNVKLSYYCVNIKLNKGLCKLFHRAPTNLAICSIAMKQSMRGERSLLKWETGVNQSFLQMF